jgi:hypothetical protein
LVDGARTALRRASQNGVCGAAAMRLLSNDVNNSALPSNQLLLTLLDNHRFVPLQRDKSIAAALLSNGIQLLDDALRLARLDNDACAVLNCIARFAFLRLWCDASFCLILGFFFF